MARLVPLLAMLLVILASVPGHAAVSRVMFGYSVAGDRTDLRAWLYSPDDGASHPALVLMHGCSGIEGNHHAWAKRFVKLGYVAIVVDGFSTRGIDHVCTRRTFLKLSFGKRIDDAYAAAAYLRTLPAVDGTRVGVVGWSHGGIIALKLAAEGAADRLGLDVPVEPFRAVVAFYPYCGVSDGDVTLPLLILIGSEDDWTPAGLCIGFTEMQNTTRPAVELVNYDGATHSFDERSVGAGINYLGHWLRYDASVTEDAAARVAAFLADNLN